MTEMINKLEPKIANLLSTLKRVKFRSLVENEVNEELLKLSNSYKKSQASRKDFIKIERKRKNSKIHRRTSKIVMKYAYLASDDSAERIAIKLFNK